MLFRLFRHLLGFSTLQTLESGRDGIEDGGGKTSENQQGFYILFIIILIQVEIAAFEAEGIVGATDRISEYLQGTIMRPVKFNCNRMRIKIILIIL